MRRHVGGRLKVFSQVYCEGGRTLIHHIPLEAILPEAERLRRPTNGRLEGKENRTAGI